MSGGHTHQDRPFSPYRHAPTNEDLLHAAIRGRAISPQRSNGKQPSVHSNGKVPSAQSPQTRGSRPLYRDEDVTPTPSRPHSPELNQDEQQIVQDTLARTAHTSRTSYAASALEPEIANSHFHDMDLCILLQQESDPTVHDVVKKAIRKAVRQRIKKLGMKYDQEVSIDRFLATRLAIADDFFA